MNEIATAQKWFDSIQKSITSVQESHGNLLGKQKMKTYIKNQKKV